MNTFKRTLLATALALLALPVMADPAQLHRYWEEQQELQTKAEQLYDRWDELEQRRQG